MKHILRFQVAILILIFTECSHLKINDGGGVGGGRVNVKCSKPDKRYTKTVDVAVKGSVKTWKSVSDADLASSVKTEVIKLTDYSEQGLDMDLLLFRICQLANNRALSKEQMDKIIDIGMSTWTNRMTIKEQRNIISQLKVELDDNLKTANELKLNTETILTALNMVSGTQVLRNPGIKILPVLFPINNLENNPSLSVSDMVDLGINKYLSAGLDTNKLEKYKFSEVGKIIAMTIDRTLPTLNSLADRDGSRYKFNSKVWDANSMNLSKIDIFDITKFQNTYSQCNSLRTNYNIVVNRAVDYLSELNKFFKPDNNVIKKDDLQKILTSERFAYELITTYANSLVDNIQNLTKLQEAVNNTLK